MKKQIKLILVSVITAAGILINSFPIPTVQAFTGCGVTVTPGSVQPGSTSAFTFTITNNDSSEDIQSMNVLRPSADFTITGFSSSDWYRESTADDAIEVRVRGGALEPGRTTTFTITATAANAEAEAANWSVFVANSLDGSGSVGCYGTNSTEISSQQQFLISNMRVSAIVTDSATVTWQTNRAASSRIDYGSTPSYGKSVIPVDDSYVNDHTVTVRSLAANTTYYFKATSITEGGQSNTQTGTFKTSQVALTPTTPIAEVNSPTGIAKPTPVESIPPTISSSTDIKKVFKETPTILGVAADNAGLANVEYSTDGGLNWLKVEGLTAGAKNLKFSFTPLNLQDGNYEIVLRATDVSGNQAVVRLGEMVIDKLPPTIGGSSMSFGTQQVTPDKNGIIRAIAGLEQNIVMSAVGGATSINIDAILKKGGAPVQTFGLSRSGPGQLWSGALNFTKGGTYELIAKSVDGANNQSSRVIGIVVVANKGLIKSAKTGELLDAKLTVYIMSPETKTWQVWSGGSFGQKNPTSIAKKGGYSFLLPAGTYYMKAQKKGYNDGVTRSFTLKTTTPVSSDLSLKPARGIAIGKVFLKLPNFSLAALTLTDEKTIKTEKVATNKKQLPQFSLQQTDGTTVTTADTFGRPTVISLVSSWSSASQEQLPILAETAKEYPELKIIPVSSGESISRLISFSAIGGYDIAIAADTSNALLNSLSPTHLPTHYFIDRRGVVVERVIGVISKQEIIKNVSN